MDDNQLKRMAAQLACPTGEAGEVVAEKMNAGNALISSRAINALAASSGETIAEIGPGNGELTRPVVTAIGDEGHFIGMELSPDMARLAAARLNGINGARITMHVGDCMEAPVEAGELDGLFAVNLLYFVENLAAFSARIAGWLRPGGRAVFGVRSEKAMRDIPFTKYGFHLRPTDEIRTILLSNGFISVDISYQEEGTTTAFGGEVLVDSLIITART